MLSRNYRAAERSGLSVIELLVVIAVIGVLAALLLPALFSARQAVHSVDCQSRLRQIMLATQTYVETFGCYPPQSCRQCPEEYSALARILLILSGSAESTDDLPTLFLPPGDGRVELFQCPSDGGGVSLAVNYGVNAGNGYVAGHQGLFGVVGPGGFERRPEHLTDGTSNTGFASEWIRARHVVDPDFKPVRSRPEALVFELQLPPQGPPLGGQLVDMLPLIRQCQLLDSSTANIVWSRRGLLWLENGYDSVYTHVTTPNTRSCTINGGWFAMGTSSNHPGGVNLLMADGSLRFISNSIDQWAWNSLGTPGSGD